MKIRLKQTKDQLPQGQEEAFHASQEFSVNEEFAEVTSVLYKSQAGIREMNF